jgi:branched-chain amino acid aminotransferase
MLAYVNGEILPDSQASISIFDRGFLYGDGVFETLRTYNRELFRLTDHLKRLERSARAINLPIPGLDFLREALVRTLRANQVKEDVLVRITVTRGKGSGGIVSLEPIEASVVVSLRPLPVDLPEVFTEGWQVIIAKRRRLPKSALDPGIKSLNFLNNILARAEATQVGAHEAIMLNERGFVTEGSISNVFLVYNQRLITPSESDGLLPGISRQVVMELARRKGMLVKEVSIKPELLFKAEEVFLTLTSAGIMPIVKVNDRFIANGKPGRITNELYQDFNRQARLESKVVE